MLARVTLPTGAEATMTYADGLMTTFDDLRGFEHDYTYSPLGRLETVHDASGSQSTLARTSIENGHEVTSTSADGRVKRDAMQQTALGTVLTNTRRTPLVLRPKLSQYSTLGCGGLAGLEARLEGLAMGEGLWAEGVVVGDRYRIESFLDQGAAGEVYAARNVWTDRRVALKRLQPQHLSDATTVERFLLEGRIGGRIDHPNVVQTLDMGSDGTDGSLFIVQELLRGGRACAR